MKGGNVRVFNFGGSEQKKAVAYYRHSAEDKQENSVPIQREHTERFAQENQIEIIHEEKDEGKTGLLADRPGFKSLFENWIVNDNAPHFDYVLVYDVSRWGRFQNQNEPAHYEFICNKQGKKVIYVQRGFQKENEPISYIQTAFERYMAAEYSRQLSEKVFYGCVEVSKQGYSAGGSPCYGMDRLLLDEQKNPKGILKAGEHKAIDNQRVTFIPSADQSAQVVKEIFRLFVEEHKHPTHISQELNELGLLSASGKKWNQSKVLRILRNQVYTGTRVYNKTWHRLKEKKRDNPTSEWITCPNAFPALIDAFQFSRAQDELQEWSNERKRGNRKIVKAQRFVIDSLKKLLTQQGFSEDDVYRISRQFPVLYSIADVRDTGHTLWYFTGLSGIREYNNIIGVSVNAHNQDLIDRVFHIPVHDFSIYGLHVFSDHDYRYQKYLVAAKGVDELFLQVAHKVKEKFYS